MSELVKRTATWMARAVREGEVSAVELLDAHAERMDRRNGEINAIVLPRLEAARAEAEAADAARSRGEPLGPLHGVPFTVKEVLDVAGMPTTNGSLLLADRVAHEDSELVRRVRDAGAILLGKTNLSEFSGFWDSVNLVYGKTVNPHDHTRSAGGSSGGEAAALAAAMSPLGIGSDLTGSIRAPAHWNGVFGLRCSRDALPFAPQPPLPATPGIQMFGALARWRARRPISAYCSPCSPSRAPPRSPSAASRSTRRTGCSRSAAPAGKRYAAPPRRSRSSASRWCRTSRRGPPTCARPST